MDLFTWAEQRARSPVAPPVQRPGSLPADALPDEYHAIASVLTRRRGAAAAITAEHIAIAAGLWPDASRETRRTRVRQVIRLHLGDFPWPVVADHAGYYIAVTADEFNHYVRNMRSRIREDSIRLRTIIHKGRECGFRRGPDKQFHLETDAMGP